MQIKTHNTYQRILIIAEIGNNHEGNIEVARQMVRAAATCGVHAVKFQTFRTDLFVNQSDAARYSRMQQFELSQEEFSELADLARSLGLLFISTPLDLQSARFLAPLVDCFKIASGDNNFYPLLEDVAESGKPVIISSGISDLKQIRESKALVEGVWQQNNTHGELAVLHCVSNYPVEPENANLSAITNLQREIGGTIGYSDHTLGVEACLLSVALGARIIEKHFTLDKNYSDFRDHQMSADPREMKELVESVTRAAAMMGDGEKIVGDSEKEIMPLIRRSIVAARPLVSGHRVTSDDIMWLRPGNGLAPGKESQLLGKTITRALNVGEPIQLKDVA